MSALSRKHRETLELAYDEDLTQSQIAARLEIPLDPAKFPGVEVAVEPSDGDPAPTGDVVPQLSGSR